MAKTPRGPLLEKGRIPDLTPEERAKMVEYLNQKLQQMANGKEATKLMIKLSKVEWLINQLRYFDNGMSCIRWLIRCLGAKPRKVKPPTDGANNVVGFPAERGSTGASGSQSTGRDDGGGSPIAAGA